MVRKLVAILFQHAQPQCVNPTGAKTELVRESEVNNVAADALACVTRSSAAIILMYNRADSRFVPSQWETALQSNAVPHWLGANLESALHKTIRIHYTLMW